MASLSLTNDLLTEIRNSISGTGFVVPSQYDKEVYNWEGDVLTMIEYYLNDIQVFRKRFVYDGNGNVSEISISVG